MTKEAQEVAAEARRAVLEAEVAAEAVKERERAQEALEGVQGRARAEWRQRAEASQLAGVQRRRAINADIRAEKERSQAPKRRFEAAIEAGQEPFAAYHRYRVEEARYYLTRKTVLPLSPAGKFFGLDLDRIRDAFKSRFRDRDLQLSDAGLTEIVRSIVTLWVDRILRDWDPRSKIRATWGSVVGNEHCGGELEAAARLCPEETVSLESLMHKHNVALAAEVRAVRGPDRTPYDPGPSGPGR